MLKLHHHTDLASAISIIEQGVFLPLIQTPGVGDTGLNCYVEETQYRRNQHQADGVILILEWHGKVTDASERMLEPNWLCHWGSWRSVVTQGTTEGLFAVDLFCSNSHQWTEVIRDPPWFIWRKRRWTHQTAKKSESVVRHLLRRGVQICVA